MGESSSTAAVTRRLAAAGFALAPEQRTALAQFLTLLARWNRVHNLTAVRDPQDAIDRHLLESLALGPLLRGADIADIGTGAGLPGMPLAIVSPERRFTLIESRAKRVHFLAHAVGALGLRNVVVAHCRAENFRPERPFATVLARAVAKPPKLLELCRPLLAPGGAVVLSTTAGLAAELARLAPEHGLAPAPAAALPLVRGSVLVLERMSD